MFKYEITLIVDESATDESTKSAIESAGAKIVSSLDLGVKKFTYPINKKSSGRYFSIEFECEADALKKIEKAVKADNLVMRFLVIKALRKPLVLKKTEPEKAEKTDPQEAKVEKVEAKPVAAEKVAEPEETTIEEIVENEPEKLDQEEIEADDKAEEQAKAELKATETTKAETPKTKTTKKKIAKPAKISAEELDEKLAELVSED